MATTFSASYNGFSFGAGTAFTIMKLKGLEDMPIVRKADQARAGDHGYYQGVDYLGERIVEIELFVPTPTNQAGYEAQVLAAGTAFQVQPLELPLVYTLGDPALTKLVNCRPTKFDIPREPRRWGMTGLASIQLVASDPRKYDSTLQQQTVNLPTVSGGLTFPVGPFPVSFGQASTGGTISATNAGNFATYPVLVIHGPVDNPTITNQTTGAFIASNISLLVSDTLTIDCGAGSILLNGTASRRNTILAGSTPLRQFLLQPGLNTLRYTANTAQVGSTLTASWRSAWIP